MIHISNNFVVSKVHSNLIKSLAVRERQYVFVPIRRRSDRGINDIDVPGVKVYYCYYPGWFKFFPLFKVIFLSIVLSLKIVREIGVERLKGESVLAHNLWSDGVPTLFLNFIFGNRYVLVVRNSDINFFIPKLRYLRWLIGILVNRSSSLVFVSDTYRSRFLRQWPNVYEKAKAVHVIPNGIESSWLKCPEKYRDRMHSDRKNSVVYVGKFDQNKNIKGLYDALCIVRKELDTELIVVGGTRSEFVRVCGITGSVPAWVSIVEWIDSKDELEDVFLSSRVFAMPSFRETFGLVYIEALSCGCSVLHSREEGIDGYFQKTYIEAVDPRDINEISSSLKKLLVNYPSGISQAEASQVISSFDWATVADNYMKAFSN